MKIQKNLFFTIILSQLFVGCGPMDEDTLANHKKSPVSISLSSYTTAAFNPFDLIIPKSYAAVDSLKFCFKRLRFKKEIEDPNETLDDNIDLDLGQVVISSTGTLLGTVEVPQDTYKRVEFDLENDCDGTTKNSVELTNGNGSFDTVDRITIKFEGTFVVDGEKTLELGVDNILTAANNYSSGSLKDALEAVSGNL